MASKYQFGSEPKGSENVTVKLVELNRLIDLADAALDGDSNDAEHDALYSIRESLADYTTDPYRRGPYVAPEDREDI